MKQTKKLFSILLLAFFVNNVHAQTEFYDFAVYQNTSDGRTVEDGYILVVSDPIKNFSRSDWSSDKFDKLKEDFTTKANREAGFKLIQSKSNITPYRSEFQKFKNKTACLEAIRKEVDDFKKRYSGLTHFGQPIPEPRIIYVQFYMD